MVVWSGETHAQVYHLLGMKNEVTALSFSPDDRFLAGASSDKMLFLWDMEARRWVGPCWLAAGLSTHGVGLLSDW